MDETLSHYLNELSYLTAIEKCASADTHRAKADLRIYLHNELGVQRGVEFVSTSELIHNSQKETSHDVIILGDTLQILEVEINAYYGDGAWLRCGIMNNRGGILYVPLAEVLKILEEKNNE